MAREAERGPEGPTYLGSSLLYRSLPVIDGSDLDRRVSARLPHTRRISDQGKTGMFHFAHEGDVVQLKDAAVPAQAAVLCCSEVRNARLWNEAIPHARTFGGASLILPEARAEIIALEFMAFGTDYKKRLHLFQNILVSVLECAPPIGLLFHASQKIIQPSDYLASQNPEGTYQALFGAVNVRLFRITNTTTNEIAMDSIGLHAFGLPDVQMHFRDLECGRVAGLLYSLAEYIFDNGDIIEDGHTTQGFTTKDRWRCRHEMSLVGPNRIVLDIDPGDPFAAGGRKR